MITHTDTTKNKQTKMARPAKKQVGNKAILQAYKQNTVQLASMDEPGEPVQKKANNTGLPDQLKAGVENLSGYSLDDVNVHYNSSQPATLQAHAYAQGTDIHVAPGQEKHLPHEAWHVVQQKQGRVKPTMQMKGSVPVNDDAGLEKEADVMGAKALQPTLSKTAPKTSSNLSKTAQLSKTGIALGAVVGGLIGMLGLFAGPIGAMITIPLGMAAGSYIGHKLTQEPTDFSAHSANEKIDPDQVGEENNGIRELKEEDKRPDDVPLNQEYRLAMHRLHDVTLILQKANKTGKTLDFEGDIATFQTSMTEIQKRAKDLAKQHKAAMRDLSSTETLEALKNNYQLKMNELVEGLNEAVKYGEDIIEQNELLKNKGSLEEEGTKLWRTQWLSTKKAVNTAMTPLWGKWSKKLKTAAADNIGDPAMDPNDWKRRVTSETWNISYGGSLMKGYKGPPKQNTRFLASNFDVDANMDAPAIAEYLITMKGRKVDRQQLDPKDADTQIENMDLEMDQAVKKQLVVAKLVPDENEANKIVSEEFETRVNAPQKEGSMSEDAQKEVKRSANEQKARDAITSVRLNNPELLPGILERLPHEIVEGSSLKIDYPLSDEQIKQINTIIRELT